MSNAIVKAFLDHDSETFSYVVHCPATQQAAVIDPVLDFDYKSGRTSSTGAQRLVDYMRQQRLQLQWILETHAHADHLSAAPFIKQQLGGQIGIGERIQDVQKIFKEVFNLEKEFLPNGAQFDRLFADGDQFSIGELPVRVMHTPGHTPADLAYIVDEQLAFVGDTLFMPDVGTARCDFPGGSAAILYASIQKILAMPDSTQIYLCHDYPPEGSGRGHEFMTTVGAQKRHSKHVKDGVTEDEFVAMREARDANLPMPRLILPSIQVNIRAGNLPPADDSGKVYLKLPLNLL
jgi:glyoxylase-like metal-dependent hydrolase (beta-lactamase superfamily II)